VTHGRKRLAIGLLSLGVGCAAALAENTDPQSDGSQYAYGENVGWLNAEPLGDGGSGVHVGDFELSGWMWGENIGWISLSCANTASCSTVDYGVRNDGGGTLSGVAWGENIGWVNFAPATAGVSIDPATGSFSGSAWAENIGWITFASASPIPYGVKTGWSCDGAQSVPGGSPVVIPDPGTTDTFFWAPLAGATGYDVVQGDAATLSATGGDFSQATTQCDGENQASTSVTIADVPASGEVIWFIVRGVNCVEALTDSHGTYDSGTPSQIGLRDAEVAASGNDCN
jgi:hypothetical protein